MYPLSEDEQWLIIRKPSYPDVNVISIINVMGKRHFAGKSGKCNHCPYHI